MPARRLEFLAERVKDFGSFAVGIDSHGNFAHHDVQVTARKRLEIIDASL